MPGKPDPPPPPHQRKVIEKRLLGGHGVDDLVDALDMFIFSDLGWEEVQEGGRQGRCFCIEDRGRGGGSPEEEGGRVHRGWEVSEGRENGGK